MSALPAIPAAEVSAVSVCEVNVNTEYQTIKGFGGMNHPEWVGDLTDTQRKTAFQNGDNQLGMTVCRVYINDDSSQWSRTLATAKYVQSQGGIVFSIPWNPPERRKTAMIPVLFTAFHQPIL